MSNIRDWQHAYAKQAKADLEAYNVLRQQAGLPQCLSLHFLQMTCEKLCKSYLCSHQVDPRFLQTSHAYIARNLPEIFLLQWEWVKKHPLRQYSPLLKQIKNLSREIELLAPTVDNQRRPDNCEYPWEDSGSVVIVPADYSFITLTLLSQPAGQELISTLTPAINSLL